MIVHDADEFGPVGGAAGYCDGASAPEGAARRQIEGAWHFAGKGGVAWFFATAETWCGGEQGLGIWVARVVEQVHGGLILDDSAEVQHQDPVGDLADDGEVVRDEQHRQPKAGA